MWWWRAFACATNQTCFELAQRYLVSWIVFDTLTWTSWLRMLLLSAAVNTGPSPFSFGTKLQRNQEHWRRLVRKRHHEEQFELRWLYVLCLCITRWVPLISHGLSVSPQMSAHILWRMLHLEVICIYLSECQVALWPISLDFTAWFWCSIKTLTLVKLRTWFYSTRNGQDIPPSNSETETLAQTTVKLDGL